jgi:hypothetical protein
MPLGWHNKRQFLGSTKTQGDREPGAQLRGDEEAEQTKKEEKTSKTVVGLRCFEIKVTSASCCCCTVFLATGPRPAVAVFARRRRARAVSSRTRYRDYYHVKLCKMGRYAPVNSGEHSTTIRHAWSDKYRYFPHRFCVRWLLGRSVRHFSSTFPARLAAPESVACFSLRG